MSATELFDTGPMLSPRQLSLPQELINAVIDHLEHDKDDESLAQVGLVSRQWYPRTREHLFHSIHLQPDDTIQQFVEHTERLRQVIEANPSLARSVQWLWVRELSPSWFENDFKDFGNLLTVLLARFTNVSQLYLAGTPDEDTLVHWGRIPEQLRNTFYTLATRPGLRYLRIEHMDDIDLRHFIQDNYSGWLCIRECGRGSIPPLLPGSDSPTSFTSNEAGTPPSACQASSSECSTLQSLTIDDCGHVFRDFLRYQREQKPPSTWLRTRQLVVSVAPWDDAMDEALNIVLENSATLVKKYVVNHHPDRILQPEYHYLPIHPSPLAFHRFPNLVSLKINTLGDEFLHNPAINPLPEIASTLDRISQLGDESKLEEFGVEFGFSGTPEDDSDDPDATGGHSRLVQFREIMEGLEGFAELDETLSRPAFCRLKFVAITFDVSGRKMPLGDPLLRLVWGGLVKRMQRTKKRGILKLQCYER
ncbi:hypothetical protein FA13DRAFT_1733266 [Coprinellus micaceus]|uniref:F-box domain-containing protein n=1 Tax=Coprinellus micaceus TaxID=71717 RepID=A0A4Y7T9K8_COPMI|nr:hypothetical protein FA13DRAFT_1733266 [Coprinellus micaceus]